MKSRRFVDTIEHHTHRNLAYKVVDTIENHKRNLVYKVTDVTSHDDIIDDTKLVEMMTYDRIFNIPDFNLARHMSEFLKRIE